MDHLHRLSMDVLQMDPLQMAYPQLKRIDYLHRSQREVIYIDYRQIEIKSINSRGILYRRRILNYMIYEDVLQLQIGHLHRSQREVIYIHYRQIEITSINSELHVDTIYGYTQTIDLHRLQIDHVCVAVDYVYVQLRVDRQLHIDDRSPQIIDRCRCNVDYRQIIYIDYRCGVASVSRLD